MKLAERGGSWGKEVRVTAQNADTVQIVEVPVGGAIGVEARGRGEVLAQLVHRYNLPAAEAAGRSAFQLDVRYGAEQVAVNDLVAVTAAVRFTPPEPVSAGMVVLEVAVPTGLAPETATIEALARRESKIRRWDVAGRRVILYVDDLRPDETLAYSFQARALYPVRAQAVSSQVYAYYRPEWRGESLGGQLVVGQR